MGHRMKVELPPDLVADIYAAAADPTCWPEVVTSVTRWAGGVAGGFQVRTTWPELSVSQVWTGLPGSFEEAYLASFHRSDPWFARANALGEGATILSRDVISDRHLQQSEFYNELCRPHGFRDLQGAMLLRDENRLVAFGMFSPDGAAFDEGTRDRLGALVPHLSRALRMALRGLDQDDLTAAHRAAVASRGFGVVRVDAGLHVLWAGEGTAEWLATGAGPLRMQQRQLVLEASLDQDALTAAVAAAIGGCGSRLLLGRGVGDRIAVLVAPAQGDSPLHRHRSAQVLFSAPVEEARFGMLRTGFGLTAAEARVALAVARGLPLRRIAGDLGVSYHTVRAHLRQCFSKTGVRRQSALAALVHENA